MKTILVNLEQAIAFETEEQAYQSIKVSYGKTIKLVIQAMRNDKLVRFDITGEWMDGEKINNTMEFWLVQLYNEVTHL
jgi:hypothetical protein